MKNILVLAQCQTNGLEKRGYNLNGWHHLAIYPNDTNPGLSVYPLHPREEGGKKLDYSSLITFFMDWGFAVRLDHLKKPVDTGQLDLFRENTINNYDKSS